MIIRKEKPGPGNEAAVGVGHAENKGCEGQDGISHIAPMGAP